MPVPLSPVVGLVQMMLKDLLASRGLRCFPTEASVDASSVSQDLSDHQSVFTELCGDLYRFFDKQPVQDQPLVLQALFAAEDEDGQALLAHALADSLWSCLRPEQKYAFAIGLLDQGAVAYFHDFFTRHDLLSLGETLSQVDAQGTALCHALCRSRLEPAIVSCYLQQLWHSGCVDAVIHAPNQDGQTPLMLALATCGAALPKPSDPCTFLFALTPYTSGMHRHLRLHCSPAQQLLLCYHANRFDYLRCMKQALGQINALSALLAQVIADENLGVFSQILTLISGSNCGKTAAHLKRLLACMPPAHTYQAFDYIRTEPFSTWFREARLVNPLETAILSGDVAFFASIRACLQRHELDAFVPDVAYERWLCIAAGRGLLAMTKALLSLCRERPGFSLKHMRLREDPLDYAIYAGQMDVMRYLIDDGGFDVNLVKCTSRQNETGPTSIAFALLSGQAAVLHYVIHVAGAQLNPDQGHYFKRCHQNEGQALPGCYDLALFFHRRYGQMQLAAHSDLPADIKAVRLQYQKVYPTWQSVHHVLSLSDDVWVRRKPSMFTQLMEVIRHSEVFVLPYDQMSRLLVDVYQRDQAIGKQFNLLDDLVVDLSEVDRQRLTLADLYEGLQPPKPGAVLSVPGSLLVKQNALIVDLYACLQKEDRQAKLASLHPRLRKRHENYLGKREMRRNFIGMLRRLSVLDGFLAGRFRMDRSYAHSTSGLVLSPSKGPLSYLIWSFVGMDVSAIHACYFAFRMYDIHAQRCQRFLQMVHALSDLATQVAGSPHAVMVDQLSQVRKKLEVDWRHNLTQFKYNKLDECFAIARHALLSGIASIVEDIEALLTTDVVSLDSVYHEVIAALQASNQSAYFAPFTEIIAVLKGCQEMLEKHRVSFESPYVEVSNPTAFTYSLHAIESRMHWLILQLGQWMPYLHPYLQEVNQNLLQQFAVDGLLDDDPREASVGVAGVSEQAAGATFVDHDRPMDNALSDVALSDVPWWESYYANAEDNVATTSSHGSGHIVSDTSSCHDSASVVLTTSLRPSNDDEKRDGCEDIGRQSLFVAHASRPSIVSMSDSRCVPAIEADGHRLHHELAGDDGVFSSSKRRRL